MEQAFDEEANEALKEVEADRAQKNDKNKWADQDEESDHDRTKSIQLPQWCPCGIFTRSQKRRVQRMRCKEIRAEYYWHEDNDDHRPRQRQEWRLKIASQIHQPAANASMIMTLPLKYKIVNRCEVEEEEELRRLLLDPQQAVFDKPDNANSRHLKALYINGLVNGKPMSMILVDGGAAVNIMPMTMFRKLGKVTEDLVKTNMVLKDFEGNTSEAKGILNVELTVGSKTLPTTFFVIDGRGSYCCVPSTMH